MYAFPDELIHLADESNLEIQMQHLLSNVIFMGANDRPYCIDYNSELA